MPFRVAEAAGAIKKATGYKIDWKMFGGGGDVIKAMASGEIPIGEVGSSPATAAAAQGLDVEVVSILDDINDAEQLVVSEKSGVTDLAGLKGKKIATPFVSTSHYQLTYALDKAGLGAKDLQILNMRPPKMLAAWERGDIDGAFVWDPVLAKIKASGGKPILSSADVAKEGAPTFDAIIVNRAWAEKNKDFVTVLVREIDKANAAYRADKAKYTANSDVVKAIAKVVGATPADVPASLAEYALPAAAEQASPTWLGGGQGRRRRHSARQHRKIPQSARPHHRDSRRFRQVRRSGVRSGGGEVTATSASPPAIAQRRRGLPPRPLRPSGWKKNGKPRSEEPDGALRDGRRRSRRPLQRQSRNARRRLRRRHRRFWLRQDSLLSVLAGFLPADRRRSPARRRTSRGPAPIAAWCFRGTR